MSHWKSKFRNAFRGVYWGIRGQSSFAVHFTAIPCVAVAAAWLRCSAVEWCILLLCVASVLSLELVNSAIESLAKGLCNEQNEHVGQALDIASAAVLIASVFSIAIALIIFAARAGLTF